MNMNSMTLLGVRLLALYLIVESISQAGAQSTFIYFSGAGLSSFDIAALLQLLIPVMLGVLMLIKAENITNWIIKQDDGNEIELSGNHSELQSSVLRLIGIVILVFTIPNLILYGYMTFLSEPLEYNGTKLGTDPNAPGRLISALIEIGIGYYLIFHTSRIINYIDKRNRS